MEDDEECKDDYLGRVHLVRGWREYQVGKRGARGQICSCISVVSRRGCSLGLPCKGLHNDEMATVDLGSAGRAVRTL
jgi:hypothetical protein